MEHICEDGNTSGEALEQLSGICEDGNTSGKALEQLSRICEDGNRSSEAMEQPDGILQLIDKLEHIVDKMVTG